MGKNAQTRRERIEKEKKERKESLKKVYYEKNAWLKFWRRFDFWIYIVCFILLIAYPFLNTILGFGEKTTNMATIHTTMGDIKVELYANDAPNTVDNFKKLSNQGFYNGLLWHRVIKDFVIQGGDPKGDGTGGPGYTFNDEINDHKIIAGTLAMANSGENTNGSQFFIVTKEAQPSLDGKYTVFGQVVEGMDVVAKIADVPTDDNDKPLSDVKMTSIDIL